MNTYAIILAGGVGKRFSPFKTSKPLFSIMESTLIEKTINKLVKSGFKKVIIVTNKRDKKYINIIFNNRSEIETVVQDEPTGMANALISCQGIVKNNPIFVLNATDQVDQSLFDKAYSKTKEGRPFITGKKVKSYFSGGYLKVESDRVIGVVEKPGEGNEPSDLINLVFHFFPDASNFIKILKETKSNKDDVYEVAFSKLMQDEAVELLEYDNYWQATKYPWDILKITRTLLEKELKPKNKAKKVHPSAIIDENVYLEDGVIVHENAVIKGPSYIGKNTIIGNHSFIRNSYIGSHSVIGSYAEVARSYIGENCWLHKNYVGDSILEANVALGSGSVTGNFRLDEKNIFVRVKSDKINSHMDHLGALIAKDVRVGINVSLMPGVKIGSNSLIGPSALIREDIEENTAVYSESILIKKPFQGKINPR